MWNAIKAMLRSRKFLAAVLSGAVWVAGKFGADLNAEELLPVVAPLWAYIVGTAIEDVGKGKAAIEAKP